MIPDRVIYTDGHNVIVTETAIRVKNSLYRLKGVTKDKLSTVEPERVPGLLLVTFGFLLTIVGIFSVIPPTMAQGLQFGKLYLSMNVIALGGGVLFLILGLLLSVVAKKKYTVRIATALGEQDVVVSDKKEYIHQIVEALDEATIDKNKKVKVNRV